MTEAQLDVVVPVPIEQFRVLVKKIVDEEYALMFKDAMLAADNLEARIVALVEAYGELDNA